MKKIYILASILVCCSLSIKTQAQCANNNTLYISGAAPTTVGQILVAPDTWAGEYNQITGCVAGHTYRISTCSDQTFDSEITVYKSTGGASIAYNDDFCNYASELTFTAPTNGDYDLLLDEYGCLSNSIDMDMQIELVSTGGGGGNPSQLTIPTVVHVIYNNSNQNVSAAQIQSQIDILNEDFRKMNSDQNLVPSVFQGVHADMEIDFCLATEDPSGSPTTGITRTSTSTFSFSFGTAMKSNSTGGKDNWDPTKYLNVWVCNLSGGLLGFATFPDNLASAPSADGVVIDYQYFGDIGTATSPFDKGRTATHEVGHWLNLRHIWGDANCGNDFVADTPIQQDDNGGCPSFPSTSSCTGNPPNGDMFMNYMDYVDDACMQMFTAGQKDRADAAIMSYRSALATSTGCGITTSIDETVIANDINIYPNPNNGTFTLTTDNASTKELQFNIVNAIGESVMEGQINPDINNSIELDLSRYGKGLYLLRFYNDELNLSKKIIVN